MRTAGDRLWAVVPIKNFDHAKNRLAGVLTPDERRELVLAMLNDVLTALRASAALDEIVVVSPEKAIESHVREFDASFLRDERNAGHSLAVQQACLHASRNGARGIVHLPGDLPLITAEQIVWLCERLRRGPALLLGPYRRGTGTNVIAMAPILPFEFRFGPDSFVSHLGEANRRGLVPQVVRWPEVELDLDTPESMGLILDYLERSGRSLITGAFLEQLSLEGGRPRPPTLRRAGTRALQVDISMDRS